MLTRGSKPVLRKSSQSKVLLYDHDVAESDHNMEDNHVKCAKIQADTFTGYNVFFFEELNLSNCREESNRRKNEVIKEKTATKLK